MRKVWSIFTAILVAFLCTASPIHASQNESVICNHVVQPGETVYCIARGYGVDPWEIAIQSGLVNPHLIYPGQVLSIPDAYRVIAPGPTCATQCAVSSPPACSCNSYHTIVTGQNLYRISMQYGVSAWRIAQCNGIYDPDYIQIADTLCIPTP
jgi:LysM repeat protein